MSASNNDNNNNGAGAGALLSGRFALFTAVDVTKLAYK
jgi:hypothetical protein